MTYSGAPAAQRAAKRSPIAIQETKGNPWVRTHDDDGGVAQNGSHTPNNRLTETCSLGLQCTFLIFGMMLWSTDTCQIKLSTDQYHMTILQARVYSSLRSRVLLKLTADQVLVFDWIASSCQVNLLKTEPGCSMVVRKPVNSNPGLKVNQIITVSSIQMFFVYSFCFVYRFCDY